VITAEDYSSSGTVSLDLSGFMLKSAPVVSSDIYLSNDAKIKFTNGETQEAAYSVAEKTANASSLLKTTALSYDGNSSTTSVAGTMDLTGATVLLANESIPIAKLTNLSTILLGISENLSQIQNNNVDLAALTAADVTHESRMTDIETLDDAQNTRLSAIETLDAAQDGRLDALEPLTATHSASLITHGDHLTELDASIITNADATAAVAADLATTNGTVAANNTFFLGIKTATDLAVSQNSSDISSNSAAISAAAGQITALELGDVASDIRLDDIETLDAEQNVRLTAIETLDAAQDERLTSAEATLASHSSSISVVSGVGSANSSAISSLQTADTSHEASIVSLSSAVALKQDTITSGLRLNASLVGNGDVSSAKLSYLNGVTSSVQTQLDNISNAVSALDVEHDTGLLATKIATIESALVTVDTDLEALEASSSSHGSSITALLASDTTHDSEISQLQTDVAALVSTDAAQSTTNASQAVTNSAVATSLADLEATDVSHATSIASLNSAMVIQQGLQDTDSTLFVDISANFDTLEAVNTAQAATNTSVSNSIAALETYDTAQTAINAAQATTNSSVAASLTTLQTNIDNVAPAPANSKIEPLSSGTFAANELAYTFDEETIYMNQLVSNNVFDLALTITAPVNNKAYNQSIIVDCLEFKGYVNVLKINNEVVVIRHQGGESINLAPIAGYSSLKQELSLVRVADVWQVLSKIRLYYNSATNVYYDETAPTITLTGAATITHEIGSAFSDPGYSGTDNIDGDITGDVVVTGAVNDAVLGSYTLYYNVDDTKGNSAVQRVRVIDVIDTTSPVVVLVGDSVVDLVIGDSWSDPGSTVTDNSGEVLTIVEGGDTVDVNTEGAYTITYTATDSSLNAGNTTSRLVNVTAVAYTLEYDNPSTDIFTLADMVTHTAVAPNQTEQLTTVSGNASAYLNGDYAYRTGSMQNGSSYFKNIFTAGNIYASMTLGHTSFVSHLFGNMTDFTGGSVYTAAGDYVGTTMNNGSYSGPVYFAQVDSASSISYDGEFLEIKMPFFVMPSSISLACYNSTYVPKISHLMGSSDGGETYKLIETFVDQAQTMTPTFTGSLKYNAFKYIVSKIGTSGDRVITVARWQMFGKIYTLT